MAAPDLRRVSDRGAWSGQAPSVGSQGGGYAPQCADASASGSAGAGSDRRRTDTSSWDTDTATFYAHDLDVEAGLF